jgi:hypothetical protein
MRRLYFFFIKYKTIILDRLKHILVLTLLLSYQQIVFGQNSNSIAELNKIDQNLRESVFITTNANSYLTGETLLYNIFCTDKITKALSKHSKIVYFELVNSEKKTVVSQKIFLENGSGNGDFFIPTTFETGTYKIVGYTSWMLNKNVKEYFSSDIFIINPYKEKLVLMGDKKETVSLEPIADENISFDFKNKIFNNRSKIDLKINTSSDDFLNGNYTVSVRKSDGFSAQKAKDIKEYQAENQNKNFNEISSLNFTLPELRGEIISGRITSSAAEIKNKKVALSIIGKDYDLKIAMTDQQGRFIFNLEKSNPNPNIVIQLLEENKEKYVIELDKPNTIDFSSLTFSNFQLHSESSKNITERLISSQVENAYYNIKKDSLITPGNFVPFYGSKSTEFKLDDFTRFPTVAETITEILNGVNYKKENNNYSIQVFDFDENYESPLPPLVVVDGLLIEDLNEFFSYNSKNIDKVNIVKGLYYYGAKTFNGLIFFSTKKGDYETSLKGSFILKPTLLRPQAKKEYFQPDYSNTKNDRIPDYRHQLLWIPNAHITSTPISFYTSDISGKFEVILEGFSSSGKPVYIKEIIEVQDTISN